MQTKSFGALISLVFVLAGTIVSSEATATPPKLEVIQKADTGSMPKAVTVSPDGKKLVVTNFGQWGHHNLWWYDPVTLERIAETNFNPEAKKPTQGGNAVESVFSPDSKTLYVSNFNENKLMVVDADTHEVVRTVDVGLRPKIVLLNHDGTQVLVANWDSYAATIYDTKEFKQVAKLKTTEHPRGMAWTKTGKVYVAGFEGDEIDVYSGEGFADHKRLKACKHIRHMVLSPDHDTLYLSCYYLGQLGVWDVATDKMKKLVQIGQEPKSSAVSDDGRWVFVANWGAGENTVSVVDTSDWTQKFVKIPKIDQPCGLALSPDQKRVWVTGWTSKTLHTIDLGPLDLKPTKKAEAEPAPTTSASTAATADKMEKTTSWASSMTWVPIVAAPKKSDAPSTKL